MAIHIPHNMMQVKNGQKQLTQLQRKLEAALRTQMKKYPALQPYARKPYTSYIIYFAAALPAAVFLLPILGTLVAIFTGTTQLHLPTLLLPDLPSSSCCQF